MAGFPRPEPCCIGKITVALDAVVLRKKAIQLGIKRRQPSAKIGLVGAVYRTMQLGLLLAEQAEGGVQILRRLLDLARAVVEIEALGLGRLPHVRE